MAIADTLSLLHLKATHPLEHCINTYPDPTCMHGHERAYAHLRQRHFLFFPVGINDFEESAERASTLVMERGWSQWWASWLIYLVLMG